MSCVQEDLSKELMTRVNEPETMKQLLLNGADINYQTDKGWCVLFEMIMADKVALVRDFHRKGMHLVMKDNKTRTGLFWTLHHHQEEMLHALLSLGYDANEEVVSGLSALHYASYLDNVSMVEALLQAGANPEHTDNYGNTAMAYAKHYGKEESYAFLQGYVKEHSK